MTHFLLGERWIPFKWLTEEASENAMQTGGFSNNAAARPLIKPHELPKAQDCTEIDQNALV